MKYFLNISILLTFLSIATSISSYDRTFASQTTQYHSPLGRQTVNPAQPIYATHNLTAQTETVMKIIDVVKNAHSLQQHHTTQQHHQNLQRYLQEVIRTTTTGNSINQNIQSSREAIVKAQKAGQILSIIVLQGKTITTTDVFDALQHCGYQLPGDRTSVIQAKQPVDLFAQIIFTSCYQPIVERNLIGGGILSGSSLPQLQFKSLSIGDAKTQEILKHQVIEILNRIAGLWIITYHLFNLNDVNIALTYPQATLSISNWLKITDKAETDLQKNTQIGKELEAKRADITKQMRALEAEERRQAQEIQKLEKIEQELKEQENEKVLTMHKMQLERDQELKKLMAQFIKKGESIKKSETIAAFPTNLQTAAKLINAFQSCKQSHQYTHLLFTENKIQDLIDGAFKTLQHLLTTLTSATPSTATAAASTATVATTTQTPTAIKLEFIKEMNTIYSILFKKEYAPRSLISMTPEFLCFKHTFKSSAPNLTEQEASPAVASLIILWEIYKNLPTDSGTESINLPYFNKTQTVDEWLNNTKNCGFKTYGNFSLPLAPGRPSHLDIVLSACTPEKEPSFFDKSFAAIGDALGSIGGWFSSTWTRLTAPSVNLVDQPDTIKPA